MTQREEICRTRRQSKLSCIGCQYSDSCDKKDLPEDVKPGTKQSRIYGLLKEGKTAKEIIATKEFASESVYIVARKYFPDAIDKTKGGARKKEEPDKAMQAVDEYLKKDEEPAPEEKEEPVEKLEKMERTIQNAEKQEKLKKRAVEWMRAAIEKLEAGELVKCRTAVGYAIGLLEMEEKT